MEYNGYTNRSTWLVPLHFNDFFDDYIKEQIEVYEGDKEKALSDIRNYIEETVTEIYEQEIEKIDNIFVKDLIDFEHINYTELAEHFSYEIFKEYFEEKIQEIKDTLDTLKDDTNADRFSDENLLDIKSAEKELNRLLELQK